MKKWLTAIICSVLLWPSAIQGQRGQLSIGIKVIGFAFHPKASPHPHLYPNGIDRSGRWVSLGGILLTGDWHFAPDRMGLHVAQGFLLDCANRFAGFTHVGIRILQRYGRHTLSGTIGPGWFYRKSWTDMPGYMDEGLFVNRKGWQTSFYWYGGSLAYDYQLSPDHALSLHLIPGWPEVFVGSAGIRQYLSPLPLDSHTTEGSINTNPR